MNLTELATIFNEKKKAIDEKYASKLEGISKLEQEIADFETKHTNNTQKWIDEKKEILQKRLLSAQNGAEKFLNTQMEQLQAWFDGTKADIDAWIEKKITDLAKAAAGISV